MDVAATLSELYRSIDRDGAVVLFDSKHPDVPANAWHAELRALVDRCVADDPTRVVRDGWPTHQAILLASPFAALESIAITERSEEHTSELQSPDHLVCRLLLQK